jgi:biopolymer transport protein ExbD
VDAPALSEPRLLDVVVHNDGRIECAGKTVTLAALASKVRQEIALQPETVLRLGADEATDYKHVVEVIATLQKAGGERLAFATRGGETSATVTTP